MLTRSGTTTAVWLALSLAAGAAAAELPHLGKPLDEADIAAWDISIQPGGTGLPTGAGTPAQGARIYAEKCAQCHGPDGKGGVAGVTTAPLAPLVGGDPITDISAATKRIANFWPYSTTLFDYIRRAMPWQQPMTLANDEVYALTAYILALNKLIGENDTINAQALPKVRMPNRDGFIVRFPDAM
jgi:S-disulfanyl-L-cysteine oxidoreductase SoxD